MNTLRKSIIIGMTVLGLGSASLAVQAHEPKGEQARHGQMHAKWSERAAKREQKLHDALKLTSAQEGAWASYASAIKPAAQSPRGQRGTWKTLTAPERIARRIEMTKQRTAVMEARLAATTSFYGVLSDEQKKLFDENSMQRGGHRMKRGMHG
jgi:protein CpxP